MCCGTEPPLVQGAGDVTITKDFDTKMNHFKDLQAQSCVKHCNTKNVLFIDKKK